MIVAILIVILTIFILLGTIQKKTNAVCESKKRLDGKTALVTGGTAGMGLEIATELARRGARVLIASPFPDEGRAAREHITRASRNQDVHFHLLDQASLADTRRFAAEILSSESRLDLLINNAGVIGPLSNKTSDGMNLVMQVNYFGTFLLTLLLLPLLKKSGSANEPSRIVNTASILHRHGTVDFDNFSCKKIKISCIEYYCDSKFCVVLFTRELAKKLAGENTVVNSVNPGVVGTSIFNGWNSLLGAAARWFCFCCFKTPWQGAQTALYAALDQSAGEVSGEFFENCRRRKAVPQAYDDKLANKVWEESLRVVKLNLQ